MTLNERIRKVVFQHLLETRAPVPVAAFTDELGESPQGVEAGLSELDKQGLIRRNPSGAVVGSVGLSVEPSRHELYIRDQQFWTWCAYDAVGILAALGASGRVLSKSPLTGTPIDVHFLDGVPDESDVVLFMPDFFASLWDATASPESGVSVVDEWCPQINLFEDRTASRAWAEQHRIPGQTLSLAEAAARGAIHWQPLVPESSGSTASPKSLKPS